MVDYTVQLNNQTITATVSLGSGVTAFTDFTDTPSTYVGQAGKFVKVNSGETALEFVASSASIADADYGDITVSSSGTVWTVDNNVVTFAKMQDVATNRILGRSTAGTGDIEELADADARTIMGLATSDSPQFTAINVGHATDTTLSRTSAGRINVEGTEVILSGDNVSSLTNDSGFIADITGENLADLSDIIITTPADNEVLAYNSGTSTWINQTASEAGLAAASHTHTASDITDFDTEVSNNVNVAANTTHISSDGTDHTYIDQDVTTTATPTFSGLLLTNHITRAGDTNTVIQGTADQWNFVTGASSRLTINNTGISVSNGDLELNSNGITGAVFDADSNTVTNIGSAEIKSEIITGLTEDSSPDGANDYVMTYDNSATALKKVKLNNLRQDEVFEFALSDETTALTTGTAKLTWRAPFAFTLNDVRASVTTAPTDANLNIDINEGGVSIFSTILSIDATEKTSTTAATAAVISDSSIADDAEITFDIDQVGSTVAGAGLKVKLYVTRV